jgi:hypothetical protein
VVGARRIAGRYVVPGGDDWELSGEPVTWDVAIPTDDVAIARRRRALAPIQVLSEIERNKGSLEGDFWGRYDLFNIALAVIDQVALAMGISAGRTWDEAVEYAAGQAARQVPEASEEEWWAVARRVVVSLVTTDVETVPYLVQGEAGPEWRVQRFRLLYLHVSGGDREEHLRASEEAINVFVEALDLDIEAAQLANEAQLSALIARGAVSSAVQLARQARYRSIQYQERIRRIVADTLIDPDTHDWVGDVPVLLDDALRHVADRLEAESALLEAVADRRAAVDDVDSLVAANQLIEILRECRHRHSELHLHLLGARSRLREALDERFARPPGVAHRYSVHGDLLVPLLARSTGEAALVADRIVARVAGMRLEVWPSLAVLTDELCARPREPDNGETFTSPEFDEEDRPEWWEAYDRTVEDMFGGIDEPIRLSVLCDRAEGVAGAVTDDDGRPLEPRLLVAAVVHAAHRAWAARLAGRDAGERLVVAVETGERLERSDVTAEDLVLLPAVVTQDIAETPATLTHLAGVGTLFDEVAS